MPRVFSASDKREKRHLLNDIRNCFPPCQFDAVSSVNHTLIALSTHMQITYVKTINMKNLNNLDAYFFSAIFVMYKETADGGLYKKMQSLYRTTNMHNILVTNY